MSAKEVWVLILGIVFVILCYFLANTKEDIGYYTVSIGDNKINYYVIENVKKLYIEDVIETNYENKAYFKDGLLEIKRDDLSLDIKSYFCSDKKGRVDCKSKYVNDSKITITEKNIDISKLTIMKDDKTLYDGKYITNLEDLLKEDGRYYFIVTMKERVVRTVKNTKLLFSVKVSG